MKKGKTNQTNNTHTDQRNPYTTTQDTKKITKESKVWDGVIIPH